MWWHLPPYGSIGHSLFILYTILYLNLNGMINIQNLHKAWGNGKNGKLIFQDFNLHISPSDIVALVGKNGSGKTTLLNIIAGLDKKYMGNVHIHGGLGVKVGYVFQDYRQSLFPWLTAEDNISFPLKLQGTLPGERTLLVKKMCIDFEVQMEISKFVYELSGGQQQKVAILRALAVSPDILLLDEPFSAIDHEAAFSLIKFLQDVWQKTKITIIFISHNVDEVLLLAGRVLVLGQNPSKIICDIKNPISYPRTVRSLIHPEFNSLKSLIIESLMQ